MALYYVLATVPAWFKITNTTATEILGSTSLRFANAVGVIEVDLRVHERDGVIAVQEQVPGTRFPKICHERHLQSDEHFCIGYDAGKGIVTIDHAVVWWEMLKHFLRLQRVAERTRRWPPQQELAHGSAGSHQLAALEAARQLGIEQTYMDMLAGGNTWFSDPDLLLDSNGTTVIASFPCPVGCEEQGVPLPWSECCSSDAVVTLLLEEKLRREEVRSYYTVAKLIGEKCCGSMLTCGLNEPALPPTKHADTSSPSNPSR